VADIVITPANVVPVAGGTLKSGYAGAAVAAGKAVYLDPADGKVKLAKANVTDTESVVEGVALNGADVGQPVWYIVAGTLNVGVVLTIGKLYVLSGAAAGGIAPAADLAAGWRTSVIGWALTTSQLLVTLHNTKVVN
jgi:hypothetical protein